jgi:carotenoid cleavage dioxygenase
LYTGLRDITPVWRVLLPRLFTKIVEDWRAPDSPFWVVQSKNTANNGVKAHAGALLATYESGAAYEVELNKSLKTRGVCDFRGSFGTADYWLDNMTAHAKTCPATGELVYMGYNLISVPDVGPFGDFFTEKKKKKHPKNDGRRDRRGGRARRADVAPGD